jgi:hypothetical protein
MLSRINEDKRPLTQAVTLLEGPLPDVLGPHQVFKDGFIINARIVVSAAKQIL